MTNYFKGDALEVQVFEAMEPTLLQIGLSLDDCFENIYESEPLGAFLWDEGRVPLTNAIRRDIFIGCFKQIFEAWTFCGTPEAYLTVFRKIFGDDAVIEFTIEGPGHISIDVTTDSVTLSPFIARRIVDNAYVFDNVVDDEGDNICFQTVLGIETSYELSKVVFSMQPNGIFTEVSLTIG